MSGAVDKLQGGYQTTTKASAKRQAPQAKAQINPAFQKKANTQHPFHGQGHRAKTKPGSNNHGRGRGAGKSGMGGHWLPLDTNYEGSAFIVGEGATLQGTDFGPITRENSQQARLLFGRLVHDRLGLMGPENSNAWLSDPFSSVSPTDIRAKI